VNLRTEALELAACGRVEMLDRADDDTRIRQLPTEPADRFHEPQRLGEVLGVTFRHTADDDVGSSQSRLGQEIFLRAYGTIIRSYSASGMSLVVRISSDIRFGNSTSRLPRSMPFAMMRAARGESISSGMWN